MTPDLQALQDAPCTCVLCGECAGSGKVWYYDARAGCDEREMCDGCDGSGISEMCDRCQVFEEWERDEFCQ